MNEINSRYSPRATLAVLGLKLRALGLLEPIRETVTIEQKTVRHSPLDKLLDALITILAGAHGLCEINTRLRRRLYSNWRCSLKTAPVRLSAGS